MQAKARRLIQRRRTERVSSDLRLEPDVSVADGRRAGEYIKRYILRFRQIS
jgi:hypothetical protein